MLYAAYGLTVRSEFPLPELKELPVGEDMRDAASTVDIVAGRVPAELAGATEVGAWIRVSGGDVLYLVTDIARILVQDGRRVVVEMEPGARESDMRTYLLGSGLGTILHQRGLVPLHVSAVLTPSGAIAFTGPPGAGKSTMAATLNAEFGWPLVCDDVAVLSQRDSAVLIESGTLRCRLWKDALDRLGVPVDGLEPDLHRMDKYGMVKPDLFVHGPQRLAALFELDPAEKVPLEVRDVSGRERLTMTMRAIYRPFLVRLLQDEARVLGLLSQACGHYRCAHVRGYRHEEARELLSRALPEIERV
jgi:hypothetical protein